MEKMTYGAVVTEVEKALESAGIRLDHVGKGLCDVTVVTGYSETVKNRFGAIADGVEKAFTGLGYKLDNVAIDAHGEITVHAYSKEVIGV
jgi:hypothetical protein